MYTIMYIYFLCLFCYIIYGGGHGGGHGGEHKGDFN